MRGGDQNLCEEQQRPRDRRESWQVNEGSGLKGCKTLQGNVLPGGGEQGGTGSLEEEETWLGLKGEAGRCTGKICIFSAVSQFFMSCLQRRW